MIIKTDRMRFLKPLLPVLLIGFLNPANAQSGKKCCDIGSCKEKAAEYAVTITGMVNFLGNCSADDDTNKATLSGFQTNRPGLYDQLIRIVTELEDYFFKDAPKYNDPDCFSDALPTINKSNVLRWINYIRTNVLKIRPKFPSTEFCAGWKKRFELGQGAAAFLNKTKMTYLGSMRGYLMYTFKGKEKCGGNFRLMAGPAFFLRSRNSYIALSSRLSVRLADLKANVFSLGNFNLLAGYNSNFDGFNYAEAGLEAELGPFGFNLSGNYNTDNKKIGFLVGIIFGNKKI